MNTPLTFSAPNHEYEQAFHELMVRKAYEQKASIKERCRYLAFAVVDPRCPMHYYFDKSPSLTRVAYWIGEEKSPPRQVPHPVRDAVFQMSGRLGLLYTNGDSVHGQVKFRLQKPSEQEYEAIAFTRISLEAEGLKRLHLHEDRALKQRVVQRLREINIELKHIEERCKLVDEREWEERIGSDPLFASYADEFYFIDARLHRLPLQRTGLEFLADVLQVSLERARLTASDRLLIVKRLAGSYAEHNTLIDTVAKDPSPKSTQRVMNCLEAHVASARKHFESCLLDDDANAA